MNEKYDLDHIQVLVLNVIFLAQSQGRSPKVGDILALAEIASQATIHAALKRLQVKELITLRVAGDGRVRYCDLSKLGLQRYEDLSKAASDDHSK